MAFAKTGCVSLCTVSSEMIPPGGDNLVEMLEDDLANLAAQRRSAVILELLHDIEAFWEQPILAFGFAFTACIRNFIVQAIGPQECARGTLKRAPRLTR